MHGGEGLGRALEVRKKVAGSVSESVNEIIIARPTCSPLEEEPLVERA
jgi:hypothetical protein